MLGADQLGLGLLMYQLDVTTHQGPYRAAACWAQHAVQHGYQVLE
jgi:hypothetical protein